MLVVSLNPSQNEFLLSYGGLGMHLRVAWCDTCLGTIRAPSVPAGRAPLSRGSTALALAGGVSDPCNAGC